MDDVSRFARTIGDKSWSYFWTFLVYQIFICIDSSISKFWIWRRHVAWPFELIADFAGWAGTIQALFVHYRITNRFYYLLQWKSRWHKRLRLVCQRHDFILHKHHFELSFLHLLAPFLLDALRFFDCIDPFLLNEICHFVIQIREPFYLFCYLLINCFKLIYLSWLLLQFVSLFLNLVFLVDFELLQAFMNFYLFGQCIIEIFVFLL